LETAVGEAGLIQAPQYIVAKAIQRGELVPVLTPYALQEGTIIRRRNTDRQSCGCLLSL
jgi:hypothetical protein